MIRAFSAGGGASRLDRDRQRVGGDRRSCVDLGRQVAHVGEVALEAVALVLGQRAEHVGAGGVGPVVVIAVRRAHVEPSRRLSRAASRIFSSPSRMRPFTVPTGVSSISAISVWVKPPK